jgi:hypothetical protein
LAAPHLFKLKSGRAYFVPNNCLVAVLVSELAADFVISIVAADANIQVPGVADAEPDFRISQDVTWLQRGKLRRFLPLWLMGSKQILTG